MREALNTSKSATTIAEMVVAPRYRSPEKASVVFWAADYRRECDAAHAIGKQRKRKLPFNVAEAAINAKTTISSFCSATGLDEHQAKTALKRLGVQISTDKLLVLTNSFVAIANPCMSSGLEMGPSVPTEFEARNRSRSKPVVDDILAAISLLTEIGQVPTPQTVSNLTEHSVTAVKSWWPKSEERTASDKASGVVAVPSIPPKTRGTGMKGLEDITSTGQVLEIRIPANWSGLSELRFTFAT